jgi:hypothetical protein
MTNLKVSDLTNYSLLTTTTCDSGLVATIYQDTKDRERVNLVMMSTSAEVFVVLQRVTMKEALATVSDQVAADFEFLE